MKTHIHIHIHTQYTRRSFSHLEDLSVVLLFVPEHLPIQRLELGDNGVHEVVKGQDGLAESEECNGRSHNRDDAVKIEIRRRGKM